MEGFTSPESSSILIFKRQLESWTLLIRCGILIYQKTENMKSNSLQFEDALLQIIYLFIDLVIYLFWVSGLRYKIYMFFVRAT